MRHSNVSNYNQGFTILEALIVVIIVGILAALTGPSFLSWNQRQQADAAINTIEGAIKEVQRQAMAKAKDCSISFSNTAITSTTSCLITGDRKLENVSLAASDISFNHLGESAAAVTIIVTHQDNSNLQRCLVVSTPLGLIGKGKNPVNGVCNP